MDIPDKHVAEELDHELEVALQAAVIELRGIGLNAGAEAFRTIRDYVLRNRDVILDRIKEYGIVTMENEQRQRLMQMLASEMVKQAIRDTQDRRRQQDQSFWTTRSAKIGFVVSIVTLISIAFTLFYDTFFGIAHPIHFP